MVKTKLITAKSILNRMKYIDSWFWCRYTMNPYRGCEHACVYCDARSKKYYLHEDFEETIYIKQNAPTLLRMKLQSTQTWLPDVVAMAGVCDAYQPIEKKTKLTQKLLKILLRFHYPVNISTKSTLILRDLPIFQQIAQSTAATIAFTITSTNPELVQFLEPRASPVSERLQVIKTIHHKFPKIQLGVNYMPIIPLLEDTKEDIEAVFIATQEAGADYIHAYPGMTLRDQQGVFFLKKLKLYCEKTNQMDLYHRFQTNFYPGGPNYEKMGEQYLYEKNQLLLQFSQKYQIPLRSKRWIPTDFRQNNYLAAQKLLNHAYFKQIQNESYEEWLWAGLKVQNLPDDIGKLLHQKTLPKFLQLKPQIQKFIQAYIKKPHTLDNYFKTF